MTSLMVAAAAALSAGATSAHAQEKLTVWSHFADHQGVRAFFEEVQKIFSDENPGKELDVVFYEKEALFAAQTTALPAGQGPDIIYLEPDRMQFVTNGFVEPLDGLLDLDRLEDFAKEAWTVDGKVYGVGMQAFTVELYYNTELMDQVLSAAGIELGDDYQLTQAEFQTMVETAAGMDIVPIVQGIGDRPYPGSYLVHELLLRKLGRDEYSNLWHGKLSFLDERVVDVFEYVQELVAAA
jgi:multiple sugar transport system substrate-binding protein